MFLLREPQDDVDIERASSCRAEEHVSPGLTQKHTDTSRYKQRGEEQEVSPGETYIETEMCPVPPVVTLADHQIFGLRTIRAPQDQDATPDAQ